LRQAKHVSCGISQGGDIELTFAWALGTSHMALGYTCCVRAAALFPLSPATPHCIAMPIMCGIYNFYTARLIFGEVE